MLKKHTICFKHAFDGLVLAFKTQPNYKIHFILSIVALFLSWFLKISYFELLLVIFIIIIGIVLETVNTAIEETTDAIDKKIREDLKKAKDIFNVSTPIFDKLNKDKAGRPVGGGILTVSITVVLYGLFLFLFVVF